jgi:hypothetical protein
MTLARENQVLLTIPQLMFRIRRRFPGPPLRRANLSQRGEEGDWHARIAD